MLFTSAIDPKYTINHAIVLIMNLAKFDNNKYETGNGLWYTSLLYN